MLVDKSSVKNFQKTMLNDDSAERDGKGIQSPNYISIKGSHNLGNYVWV